MSAHSGGGAMLPKESWAAVLERSLVRTTAKNVLEVVLEKDFCGSYTVSQEECAKLLLKLRLRYEECESN